MSEFDYSEAIELLRGAKTIAVCGHVNPDGDCLGSALALTLGLRSLGFEVTPLLAGRDKPHIYDFLSCFDDLVPASTYKRKPDVFIMVDVSVPSRIGDGDHVLARSKKTLVIDHHQGDAAFADLAYVDSSAAAAGVLVWDFLRQAGVELTPKIATCCFTALITDTGRFQYQNADARAFAIAADMTQAGASPSDVSFCVYQRQSWAALQLKSLVMRRMELLFGGKAVISWVSEEDFKELGANKDDGESLVDVIRQLDGAEVAVMLREQGPIVRGSIRSKTSRDVSVIAGKMGGGGHKAAAGFTLKCKIDEARKTVIELLAEALEEEQDAQVQSEDVQ